MGCQKRTLSHSRGGVRRLCRRPGDPTWHRTPANHRRGIRCSLMIKMKVGQSVENPSNVCGRETRAMPSHICGREARAMPSQNWVCGIEARDSSCNSKRCMAGVLGLRDTLAPRAAEPQLDPHHPSSGLITSRPGTGTASFGTRLSGGT